MGSEVGQRWPPCFFADDWAGWVEVRDEREGRQYVPQRAGPDGEKHAAGPMRRAELPLEKCE